MVSVKCAGSGVSRGHTATSVGRNLMIVNAKGIQLNIYIYIRMAAYKGSGRWEVWEHWVHIPFVCARSFIFGWVVWFPFDRQRADSPIPFSLGCVCVCVCDSAVYPYSGNLPFPMVWQWLSALPFDAPLNWFHDNHCSINTGQSACVVQTKKNIDSRAMLNTIVSEISRRASSDHLARCRIPWFNAISKYIYIVPYFIFFSYIYFLSSRISVYCARQTH